MTSTVVTKDAQTEEATGTVEADLENARTETGTETTEIATVTGTGTGTGGEIGTTSTVIVTESGTIDGTMITTVVNAVESAQTTERSMPIPETTMSAVRECATTKIFLRQTGGRGTERTNRLDAIAVRP